MNKEQLNEGIKNIDLLIDKVLLENSDTLELDTADKNSLYLLKQFLWARLELLKSGEIRTRPAKENKHLLTLSRENRKTVNDLARFWVDTHPDEENSDISNLLIFTKD